MDSFKDVLSALNSVDKESSTINKVAKIKEYLSSPLFLKVIKYTLDKDKQYNIKKLQKVQSSSSYSIDEIFNFLDFMSKKKGATKLEKSKLSDMASQDEYTFEIVRRIVNKKLDCGISIKRINKAVPKTITSIPYMRCSSMTCLKNIKFPAIIQDKMDNSYASFITRENLFLTRNGKKLDLGNVFGTDLMIGDYVLTGELIVEVKGQILPRKKGNGYITKAVEGTLTPEEASCFKYIVWDLVPYEVFMFGLESEDYKKRFNNLIDFVNKVKTSKLKLVRYKNVDNLEEVIQYYIGVRKNLGEGAVLKDWSTKFKNTTSPTQVKIKNEVQAEFIIKGVYQGKENKDFEGCLGGLHIESSDGKIKTNVGTGFSWNDRGFPNKGEAALNLWKSRIGGIITVEFESITSKKNSNTFSLYLPRYVEYRIDKDQADDYEYVVDLLKTKGVEWL